MMVEWRVCHERCVQLLAILLAIVSIGLCVSWVHPLVAVCLFTIFTLLTLKATSGLFKFQPPVECAHLPCPGKTPTPTHDQSELFPQLHQLMDNVMRDFVIKWYTQIGKNQFFPSEVRYVLEDLSVALVCRGRKVNRDVLLKRTLLAYHCFLQEYLDSAQERQKVWHVAIARSNTELKYLENIINVLLEVLVPADVLCCTVARKIVAAILAKSLLLPLVDLLSDPVWLNKKMIELLSTPPPEEYSLKHTPNTNTENVSTTVPESESGFPTPDDGMDEDVQTLNSEGECFWQRMMDEAPSTFNPAGIDSVHSTTPTDKIKPHRLPCSSSLEKIGGIVSNTFGELERPFEYITSNLAQYFKIATSEESSSPVPSEEFAESQDDATATTYDASNELNIISVLGKVLSVSTTPVLCDNLLNVCCRTADTASECNAINDSGEPELVHAQTQKERRNSQEFIAVRPKVFADARIDSRLIDNVTIPNVETVDEPGGSGQYIIYCIQYDAWYGYGDAEPVDDDRMLLRMGQVRRRFREFLALQTRLEEDAKMRPFLKGIKGINKWMMLPFGKMDKDTVAERRPVLERYLKDLISKEEIAESVHLREFLAYGSDASIAFVRKPTDITNLPVPRIDRFLVKTMAGMFDKIKTALPSLPSEGSPESSLPIAMQNKPSDRLLSFLSFGSEEKESSFMTRLNFEYGLESGTTGLDTVLSEFLSRSNANDHIDNAYDVIAEPLDQNADCKPGTSPRLRKRPIDSHRIDISGQAFTPVVECDISLTNIVIDLFTEFYSVCDPWISEDKLSHFLKVVSSTMIERKLSSLADKYTCESCWVYYIQLLRETLWPQENTAAAASENLSNAEKRAIKLQFLEAVRNSFHGVVPVVLGRSEFYKATKLFVDSLQHPQLLRNLVYHLLDILLDSLVPETRNDSFTSKLRHPPT